MSAARFPSRPCIWRANPALPPCGRPPCHRALRRGRRGPSRRLPASTANSSISTIRSEAGRRTREKTAAFPPADIVCSDMNFVFPPAPIPSLAIAGSDARSRSAAFIASAATTPTTPGRWVPTKQADGREPPFFFSKPADAVVPGGDVPYPPATANLQHESSWWSRSERAAPTSGGAGARLRLRHAVGLDLTRRDAGAARKKGHPWDMGKGLRRLGTDRRTPSGLRRRPSAGGAIWLKGEWRNPPERRPREHVVEGGGGDCQPVDLRAPGAGGSHLHRHAGRRFHRRPW